MTDFAYEWASLAILLTIEFIYLEYHRLKVERTRFFLIFIQISIIADIVNIGYTHIVNSEIRFPVVFVEIWTIVYYLLTTIVYPIFAVYLYELVAKEEWKNYHKKRFYIFIPEIIFGILLVINCFYHFIFSYTSEGMQDYTGHYFQEYIPLAYLLLIVCVSMLNRSKFTRQHVRILSIYLISSATIFLLSEVTEGSLVTGIATGLTVICAYIYIENPENYRDRESKLFNDEGFDLYTRNNFLHKEQFHCVLISLSNYKTINLLTNPENMKIMIRDFKNWCLNLSDEISVFRVYQSVFIVASKREVIVNGVYEKIKQQLKQDDEELLINRMGGNVFLVLNCLEMENTEAMTKRLTHMSEYSDPESKKNHFRSTDIEKQLNREIEVEEAVRRAIIDESFEMYFQPVYDVNHKIFDKAEALIRLNDPVLGFIPPDEFITLAEQRGLIRKITRQVIQKTIHAIKEKDLRGLGVDSVNINLSTRDMWEGDLKQFLPYIMEQEGVDASMVTLEITETAASGNKEIASDFMNKLVSLGYKFAVDDYGTGYSNIERTISLPFDSVKIDKSLFYMAMEQEKIHYLLEHTIMIFHDMGFKVVVEGAETKEHIDALHEMKIDYIQGYYYSRPLPLQQYVEFLKEKNMHG